MPPDERETVRRGGEIRSYGEFRRQREIGRGQTGFRFAQSGMKERGRRRSQGRSLRGFRRRLLLLLLLLRSLLQFSTLALLSGFVDLSVFKIKRTRKRKRRRNGGGTRPRLIVDVHGETNTPTPHNTTNTATSSTNTSTSSSTASTTRGARIAEGASMRRRRRRS